MTNNSVGRTAASHYLNRHMFILVFEKEKKEKRLSLRRIRCTKWAKNTKKGIL
ncbi:predicted protein [Botrytis cinerea T4]|uniref:Uncharacterized protein n=1 Tax=Botryotinia fuckeliana (strain T4) TaxID=999810 RepID=G2YVF0_BOTF4|nr:predicted protein [Botrytis cinerea T4]